MNHIDVVNRIVAQVTINVADSVTIAHLPYEGILRVFEHLEFRDLVTTSHVCKRWRAISYDRSHPLQKKWHGLAKIVRSIPVDGLRNLNNIMTSHFACFDGKLLYGDHVSGYFLYDFSKRRISHIQPRFAEMALGFLQPRSNQPVLDEFHLYGPHILLGFVRGENGISAHINNRYEIVMVDSQGTIRKVKKPEPSSNFNFHTACIVGESLYYGYHRNFNGGCIKKYDISMGQKVKSVPTKANPILLAADHEHVVCASLLSSHRSLFEIFDSETLLPKLSFELPYRLLSSDRIFISDSHLFVVKEARGLEIYKIVGDNVNLISTKIKLRISSFFLKGDYMSFYSTDRRRVEIWSWRDQKELLALKILAISIGFDFGTVPFFAVQYQQNKVRFWSPQKFDPIKSEFDVIEEESSECSIL